MKASFALMVTMLLVLSAGVPDGEAAEQPPPTPAEEQPEILTQGPMHEAFAEPVVLQDEEGFVVPTQPPPEVAENPPAEKPAGRQFVWVPGYWAWDPPRQGYVWVSGCWRATPPDRYWVPGYWSQTGRGWKWSPGFWAPVARVQEIEYLPAPPAIEELQPPAPPPSPEQAWVPPCWYWRHGRYVWRPGYWLAAQADWVWAPSHYVRTPRGYVFVAGHWDYALVQRGVLFAPVYFPRPVYARPGYSLSLNVVVDLGMVGFGMFACPRYSHFFFGDYYDDINIGFGIFPRFQVVQIHTWYDPIYVHDRWRYRRVNPGWEAQERREYDRRRVDRGLRPPRTYREMEARQARMPEAERRSIQVAQPLSRVVSERKNPLRFEQIKPDTRQRLSAEAGRVYRFGEERRNWESVTPGSGETTPRAERQGSPVVPGGAGESTTRREREGGEVSPSVGRERTVDPSPESREPAAPGVERRRGVMPSPDGGASVTLPPDRQRFATPSVEGREAVTPRVAPRQGVMPSPESGGSLAPLPERQRSPSRSMDQRSPTAPSVERRSATVPPRDAYPNSPERVRIPDPPVSDRRGPASIFRQGPPSRPADEQRTDFRNAPRSGQVPAERETQRSRDPSRERR